MLEFSCLMIPHPTHIFVNVKAKGSLFIKCRDEETKSEPEASWAVASSDGVWLIRIRRMH